MGHAPIARDARCASSGSRRAWCRARLRDEWRREWEGELAAAASDESGRRAARAARAGLVRRCVLDPPARRRRLADHRRSAARLPPAGRSKRALSITTVGILALSMAASVTAFSVVSQILLRPLPYPRARSHRHACGSACRRRRAAATSRPATFSTGARAQPASRSWPASSRTASTTPAAIGRKCSRRCSSPKASSTSSASRRWPAVSSGPRNTPGGNNRVVVMSARFWRSHFNSDPSIVGKTIPLDDGAFLVAGIAPDDFQPHFQEYAPGDRDLYAAKAIEEYEPRIRASGYWNVVGRLKDGVSIEQAQAEMDAISARHRDARIRAPTRTFAPRSSRCASTWSATCGRRSRCSAARCSRCC